MRHVHIYREAGRFGGWPANGGAWSWGNEILVGFRQNYMDLSGGFHAIDRSRPSRCVQARSMDGGESWNLEAPDLGEPAVRNVLTGDEPLESTGVEEPIDLEHPDFAIKLDHGGLHAGARSWFHLSYDRGHTWSEPYMFPTLGLPGIAARTDYLKSEAQGYLFFLTAAKSDGREGHTFCARTRDGCQTFQFVSWIGPEPGGWTIMPASVRLPSARILVALRCRGVAEQAHLAPHWIDLYASDNEGATWTYVCRPAAVTGRGGNPPTLTRLPDGRLCLTYGYRDAPFGMRATVSEDEGTTWGEEIILRDDGGNHDIGYPRTVLRPDGTLVTMYYYNEAAEGERYIAATLWKP